MIVEEQHSDIGFDDENERTPLKVKEGQLNEHVDSINSGVTTARKQSTTTLLSLLPST
jgi:hypothetical protein